MAISPWKAIQTHDLKGRIPQSLAVSSDGKTLAVGCNRGHITLLDTETFAFKGEISSGKAHVIWLEFIKTGLAILCGNMSLALYSVENNELKARFTSEHHFVAITSHRDTIYAANHKGIITALDAALKIHQTAITSYTFTSLLASQEYLWAGNTEGALYQFSIGVLNMIRIIETNSTSPILFLRHFPDGIAVYKQDEMLEVWDPKEIKLVSARHIYQVDAHDLIAVGHEVTSAGHGEILCDQPFIKDLCRIKAHEDTKVQALCYSIHHNRLISAGFNGYVVSWKRTLDPNAIHHSI